MIIDTIEISGILIPYADIKNYSLIQREYIFRPVFREKTSILPKILPTERYEFSHMIPYAAVITENEYNVLNKKIQSSPSALDSAIFITSFAVEQVVDYVTNGSIVANLALKTADKVKDAAVNKISSFVSREKYYCLDSTGKIFAISLKSISPLLISNDGRIIESNKIRTKMCLPDNHSSVHIGSALHVVTTSQSYLFFGNGININDVEQVYNRLEQELAYRGVQPHKSAIDRIQNFLNKL